MNPRQRPREVRLRGLPARARPRLCGSARGSWIARDSLAALCEASCSSRPAASAAGRRPCPLSRGCAARHEVRGSRRTASRQFARLRAVPGRRLQPLVGRPSLLSLAAVGEASCRSSLAGSHARRGMDARDESSDPPIRTKRARPEPRFVAESSTRARGGYRINRPTETEPDGTARVQHAGHAPQKCGLFRGMTGIPGGATVGGARGGVSSGVQVSGVWRKPISVAG